MFRYGWIGLDWILLTGQSHPLYVKGGVVPITIKQWRMTAHNSNRRAVKINRTNFQCKVKQGHLLKNSDGGERPSHGISLRSSQSTDREEDPNPGFTLVTPLPWLATTATTPVGLQCYHRPAPCQRGNFSWCHQGLLAAPSLGVLNPTL